MRLLACSDTGNLSFTKDFMEDEDIPPYAILSHTWGDQEVLYHEILGPMGRNKTGFNKIQFCIEQARRDKLYHCWIDTCCINKNDLVELQDAINSMFRWYARAARCYAFLSDVSTDSGLLTWEASFGASRWFTRGWTLQELLAPRQVIFFSREGLQLGDRTSLEGPIHEITKIPKSALRATPLNTFTVSERMSWKNGRTTTRKEDIAYSLLGIFGVHLPPIYGEGDEHALRRLCREIDASAGDKFRRQALSRSGTLQVDTVNGAQEPEGRFLVPFNRPRFFAGRERYLEQLRAHVASDVYQRFSVHGLGGSGKTALALETAYWVNEHRPTCAVFWVPAFSRDSFEEAYYQIAKLLNIPGIEDSREDIKELVKTTLSDDDFGPWLMVVDNADDEAVLFEPPNHTNDSGQLIEYLPRSHHGSIIFTTRTQAAAVRLAGENTMALKEMDKPAAIALISQRLFQEHQAQLSDAEKVDELLDLLQFHALAIVQATAFMNANNITISEYTALCRDSERDATDLLGEDFEDQGRYRGTTNSVAMTWYISFEQLQKKDQSAADHLCFMACTASNDIDASMFPPLYTTIEHIKAIGTLKAYAFVTEHRPHSAKIRGEARKAAKKYDVHPLVHLATRSWLKAHRQWVLWTETTLVRLVTIVPYGDHDTREYWQGYLHHAMHLMNVPEVQELEDRMTLLERVGRCQRSLGRYQTAEGIYRQAWDQRVRAAGREDSGSLMAMGNIALLLGFQEKWAEAEKLHREELAIAQKILGEHNPQTLITKGNLALAVLGQSKYTEAEPICRSVLDSTQQAHGPNHPDTLASMQNLASALAGQGKYPEAEPLHRSCLALRTASLGPSHPDTLSTLSALGTTLHSQRKYLEAETIHREELALRIEVLGEQHPDIVKSMQKLGHVLCLQEKYVEALAVQRKAVAISEEVSGPLRPVTLSCKSAVAHTLHNQGKFVDAEQIHREVLGVRERVAGKGHRDTCLSVYWLAEAVHDQARYADAVALYGRAAEGFEGVFGVGHQMTRECVEQVGIVRGVLDGEREREREKEKREKERADTLACASSIASRSDTASEMVGTARPQKRWRDRLQQIARRSGPRDESL